MQDTILDKLLYTFTNSDICNLQIYKNTYVIKSIPIYFYGVRCGVVNETVGKSYSGSSGIPLAGRTMRAQIVNTRKPVLEFGFHSILIEWQRMLFNANGIIFSISFFSLFTFTNLLLICIMPVQLSMREMFLVAGMNRYLSTLRFYAYKN